MDYGDFLCATLEPVEALEARSVCRPRVVVLQLPFPATTADGERWKPMGIRPACPECLGWRLEIATGGLTATTAENPGEGKEQRQFLAMLLVAAGEPVALWYAAYGFYLTRRQPHRQYVLMSQSGAPHPQGHAAFIGRKFIRRNKLRRF